MADGPRNYNHVSNSGGADPRNFGFGRPGPIGTLIHSTDGTNSLSWLTTGSAASGHPASADYLIDRDGTQHSICPAGRYPYHAGKGQLIYNNRLYKGDEVSQLLIGVELENMSTTLCTYEQHDSLAELVVRLGLTWGWRWPYYLVGHYETARPVGRRSDPQGLDWGSFMGRLYLRASQLNIAGL
jgi:N-acetyl-anhydromuramyl-L-alanine amidase AmpD